MPPRLHGRADGRGLCPVAELPGFRRHRPVVYGITNLTRDQADAARLLELNRGHWRIENSVFYVRDEAFGEDRCRVRRGSAPQILAACRNAVLNLLRLAGSQNISASLRSGSWNL